MTEETQPAKREKTPTSPPAGDAIYGLGVFGAAVFFWRRADTPGGRAVAVLKGIVWPAFMVYEGFSALEGLSASKDA